MLIIPPVPFRRKRAPSKPVAAGGGSAAQAIVVAVLYRGGNLTSWFFSVPVTLVGGDLPQLILDTDDGPQAPEDVAMVGEYVLNADYGAGDIESGLTWSLSSATGLSFGSIPVPLPQSGTVIG